MKYLILMVLVLFTLCLSGQQNLIKNGSFEEKAFGVLNDKPNAFSQLNKCKDWAADNDGAIHSPDWIKNNSNFLHTLFNNEIIQANTGEHYAGMARGEMLEQQIDNLQPHKSTKLIFYVRLASDNYSTFLDGAPATGGGYFTDNYPNAKINILLSDGKIKYKNIGNGHCEASVTEYGKYFEKQDPVVVAASIPIDLATYPTDRWHRVEIYLSKGIIIDKLDWIGFELVHDLTGNRVNLGWGNYCEIPYVLIDDVELYEIDCEECKNCSYKDGCIDVGVISNVSGLTCPEFINLGNITNLQIDIFRAGQTAVLRRYILTNPPSNFSWDLKTSNGDQVTGTFIAQIWASNDCQTIEVSLKITVPSGSTSCTNSSTVSPVSRAAPPNGQCCGEDLYLNNIVISEDHIYRANRIVIGPDVIILSGVIVEFHAETEIDISPDLIVELGADWFAYIDENCVNDDIGRMIPISDDNTIDDEIVLDKNNAGDTIKPKVKEQIDVLIYPNPTTGIVNIDRVNISNNTLIQVFDISGRLLKTKILISSQTQLDLSDYPKGTYFIRIREENRVITKKIIIQ